MITELKRQTEALLSKHANVSELQEDEYANMKYPKLITLMRFRVDRYRINGFGHLMIMHTTTKMGMELLTMSFMPSECVNMPYLLIDAMSMKKKRCIFVEYYGCGNNNLNDTGLNDVYERFNSLPNYDEKDNWYIKEREPYSLIKSGEEQKLTEMAVESVKAYLSLIESSVIDTAYKEKLVAFRERMIVEGNPSGKTLKLLLGEDGAVSFMKNVIMPV